MLKYNVLQYSFGLHTKKMLKKMLASIFKNIFVPSQTCNYNIMNFGTNNSLQIILKMFNVKFVKYSRKKIWCIARQMNQILFI